MVEEEEWTNERICKRTKYALVFTLKNVYTVTVMCYSNFATRHPYEQYQILIINLPSSVAKFFFSIGI